MNEHPANSVFRAVMGIARAQCSNHRRDDQGWPLGNCIECVDYRKKMDAWHWDQVLRGNHDPERISAVRDDTTDRNSAHAEGFGWPEQHVQSSAERKAG